MALGDSLLNIANRALTRLGADPITSLTTTTDTSTRAAVMNRLTESTRQWALRSHRWNFAEGRCTLTGFPYIPPYEFDCAYYLPDNLLTVLETNLGETEAYRVEMFVCHFNQTCNRVLVTDNACAPSITYTADIADVTKWDPLFTHAYELQLTLDAAYAFGRSAQTIGALADQTERAWRKARTRDGQEGRPKRSWLSNDLLRARHGWSSRRPDQVDLG